MRRATPAQLVVGGVGTLIEISGQRERRDGRFTCRDSVLMPHDRRL
ncbi:hypothetical protein NSERUTF1_6878 [Nocardia seriolae]|nr:hypothetical protein NSERUTF1_6878 [Nocardia seriolae]